MESFILQLFILETVICETYCGYCTSLCFLLYISIFDMGIRLYQYMHVYKK